MLEKKGRQAGHFSSLIKQPKYHHFIHKTIKIAAKSFQGNDFDGDLKNANC